MLAFFMLGLVPFLVVTLFLLYSHGKDLAAQTSNHLVWVRNIKKNQLQGRLLRQPKEQGISTSPSRTFRRQQYSVRFYGFTGAFEKLGTTPQEDPRPRPGPLCAGLQPGQAATT